MKAIALKPIHLLQGFVIAAAEGFELVVWGFLAFTALCALHVLGRSWGMPLIQELADVAAIVIAVSCGALWLVTLGVAVLCASREL